MFGLAHARQHSPIGPWRDPELAIEPIIAARAWRVDVEHMRLRSLIRDVVWPIEGHAEAVCLRIVTRDEFAKRPLVHRSPNPDCLCGIWGLASVAEVKAQCNWQPEMVLGVVRLWGLVVEGSRGWRASYAKPVALSLDRHEPPAWRTEKPISEDAIRATASNYGLRVIKRWPKLTTIEQ